MRRGPMKRGKPMAVSERQGGMSPEDLRSCSIAVYCGAVERDAADEIARRLRWAADTIEALHQRVGELEGLLRDIRADAQSGQCEIDVIGLIDQALFEWCPECGAGEKDFCGPGYERICVMGSRSTGNRKAGET